MYVYSPRSRFVTGAHRSLWRLLFAAFLLVALPVFLWAVATQRIELRKQASIDGPVCWNRVSGTEGNLYWSDGCKGRPHTNQVCTQVLVPLSSEEKTGYDQWIASGKPSIPGCDGVAQITPSPTCSPKPNCIEGNPQNDGRVYCVLMGAPPPGTWYCPAATPTPIMCGGIQGLVCPSGMTCSYNGSPRAPFPDATGICVNSLPKISITPTSTPTRTPTPSPIKIPINWQTPNVSLQADEMTIEVNTMIFTGKPDTLTPIALHSDPGSYNYTTLEAIWKEHGIEMRVFIYFDSDCTTSPQPQCGKWRVSEVRIYNGKTPGDWFIYKDDAEFENGSRPTAPWGQQFTKQTLILSSSAGGPHVLTFKNIRLQPFLQKTQVTTPTPTCIPRPLCLDSNPRCLLAEPIGGWCPRLTPIAHEPGDLNEDNVIDIFDYNILLSDFGKTGTPGFIRSDIIRNGQVDIFDYNQLLHYFNR